MRRALGTAALALITLMGSGCLDLYVEWRPPTPPPGDEEPEPEPPPMLPARTVGEPCDHDSPLAEPCITGVGACAVTGAPICRAGRVVCDATARAPGVEICGMAGEDEDCDGAVDEGVACCPSGGAATDERCNGADDDCDGEIDEGFDLGAPCVTGESECQRDGTWGCDASGAAQCIAPVGVAEGDGCHASTPPADLSPPWFGDDAPAGEPWVYIPAGSYYRGSDDADAATHEGPSHEVTLTEPFIIGSTEITVAQWRSVTGTTPAWHVGCDDCPVERVNWYEALWFANRLTDMQPGSLSRCYELIGCQGEGQIGAGCPGDGDSECSGQYFCTGVIRAPDCTGYRLPTEAEFERAARAGTGDVFWFGDDADALRAHENCAGPEGSETEPVGARRPNPFGLYDMLGNVTEWVFDEAERYPDPAPAPWEDPICERRNRWLDFGPRRVMRGGSPRAEASWCRSSSRLAIEATTRRWHIGFRLVRAPSSTVQSGMASD
ncbi:MAG: formylglycine-generating enzyme family protein [bacterium]